MFEEKFGFFPKKKVEYDGQYIYVNGEKFSIKYDIHCIYVRPFNFTKNEWGTVYLSLEGEDYNANDLLAKNVFKYTQKQTEKVWELLKMLDIEIIEKGNTLHATENTKATNVKIHTCPNCQSANIQFLGNNKKSFSVGKAAAGAVLTGGIGTLAGFAGKKGKTDNWHCSDCGATFELKNK